MQNWPVWGQSLADSRISLVRAARVDFDQRASPGRKRGRSRPGVLTRLEAPWTAAAAAAAARTFLRLVDLQRTATEILAVQRLHRARCIRIGHLHEAEAARPTGIAKVKEGNSDEGGRRREDGSEEVFGGGIRS